MTTQTALFTETTSDDWFRAYLNDVLPVTDMSTEQLAEAAERCNIAYRSGAPLIDDHRYDHELLAALRVRSPDHPFLYQVEPEPEFAGNIIVHASPMLSTDKAYTADEVEAFINRLFETAEQVGISAGDVMLRATPKLDGIAGNDRDGRLAKRGNSLRGEDVTRIFEKGVVPVGGRGLGPGEIVVEQSYFLQTLAAQFGIPHPRNFISGLVDSDEVKPQHAAALQLGKVRFVPYSTLEGWEGPAGVFLADQKAIVDRLLDAVEYLTDGVVIEAIDPRIRQALGATSHHHRWQLAIKQKGNTAITTVQGIRLQTGRTGRVTPVVEIAPVHLSGATLRNATAHTVRKLAALGLGVGAEIEVIRSGEVIPKIEGVIRPAAAVLEVTHCPSCGHALEEEGEYTLCPNTTGCEAQLQTRLEHFFHTLGNIDEFGPKTIERLVAGGYTALDAIYAMTAADFRTLGFGPVQSQNLEDQLVRSRTELVEDWRFLAAFGIRHLGRGDSRKLLAHYPIEDMGLQASEQIAAVHGFGPVTSPLIAESLQQTRPLLQHLLELGFTLQRSQRGTEASANASPISGKGIVFTGTMSGSRDEMEAEARGLGANVQGSVSGKTDILVIGEKVGQAKLTKAQANGRTQIMTEAEYRALLKGEDDRG